MVETYKYVKIDDIKIYFENPRHEVGMGEQDTLKKLIEQVGTTYMYNLIEDMYLNGNLETNIPAVVFNEQNRDYIVYEGNRRLAGYKILKNPALLKEIDSQLQVKIERLKKQETNLNLDSVYCLVTSEERAFFIMERIHSGEDSGRGLKAWKSREKDIFLSRMNKQKPLVFLLRENINKYCDIEITDILPNTTLKRIFTNREVKKVIGLDASKEETFTEINMKLVVYLCNKIVKESEERSVVATRLFNRAREIEDFILPLIQKFRESGERASEMDGNQDISGGQGKNEQDKPNIQGEPDNRGEQGEPDNRGEQGEPDNRGEQGEPDNRGEQEEPDNQHDPILKVNKMQLVEGQTLFLKGPDILNYLDASYSVELSSVIIQNDTFSGDNEHGNYFINYYYGGLKQVLTIYVSKRKVKEKGNMLFRKSSIYLGTIDLSDASELVDQLTGLDYEKHYLLYAISFRTIIERISKRYIAKTEKISLDSDFRKNVSNVINQLKNEIVLEKNDLKRQEKVYIHEQFGGYKNLRNYLNMIQEKFSTAEFDRQLHSLTHSPTYVDYNSACYIANDLIIPIYMLILLLDKTNIINDKSYIPG